MIIKSVRKKIRLKCSCGFHREYFGHFVKNNIDYECAKCKKRMKIESEGTEPEK